MVGLGKSIYLLSFDSNAKESLEPTRREIALVKKIMEESVPVADRYDKSMEALRRTWRKGGLTLQQYQHAQEVLFNETPEFVRRTNQITAAERKRQEVFRRGKAVFKETRTAAERFRIQQAALERQIRRGGRFVDAYRRKLALLRTEFAATAARGKGLAVAMTTVRMAMAGPVGAIGAVLGVSVGLHSVGMGARSAGRNFHTFTTNMARATAIMQVTGSQMSRMRDAAFEVGRTIEASSADAARSFFFLASAGLTTEESIRGMPIVAKFAQSGQFDLATATDLLTDSQSALGLNVGTTTEKMENMQKVSDVLTKANQLANASVRQFAESITTKAGAQLKVLNKTIEEGAAVLAVFADQGVKGSDAGSALNIVLRDLSTKAIKFKEAFRDAGINVFDPVTEKMRLMEDIVLDLTKAMEPLTDFGQKSLLLDLGFSDKSIVFTQMLMGTSAQMKRYRLELLKASGATDEVADKSMTKLTKAMNVARAGWEELSLAIAGPLVEGFLGVDIRDDLTAGFEDLIQSIKDAAPTLKEAGMSFREMADDVGELATALSIAIEHYDNLNRGFGKFTGGASFLESFSFVGEALRFANREILGFGSLVRIREQREEHFTRLAGESVLATHKVSEAIQRYDRAQKKLNDEIERNATLERETNEARDMFTTALQRRVAALVREEGILTFGAEAYERYLLLLDESRKPGDLAEFDRLTAKVKMLTETQVNAKAGLKEATKLNEDWEKAVKSARGEVENLIRTLEDERDANSLSSFEILDRGDSLDEATDAEKRYIKTLLDEKDALDNLKDAAKGAFSAKLAGTQEAEEAVARARANADEQDRLALAAQERPAVEPKVTPTPAAALSTPAEEFFDDLREIEERRIASAAEHLAAVERGEAFIARAEALRLLRRRRRIDVEPVDTPPQISARAEALMRLRSRQPRRDTEPIPIEKFDLEELFGPLNAIAPAAEESAMLQKKQLDVLNKISVSVKKPPLKLEVINIA